MICALDEYNEYSVLQEIKTLDSSPSTYKIRGNSLLQTLDEVNGNRRVYTHAIGEIYVNAANDKIRTKRLLGEMDHPWIRNPKDPMEVKRQLQVLLKECSHKFNKLWIEGNTICGLVETLSNNHGINMARMANIDDVPIGFSCRAIGKVKQKNYGGKPIMEVCQPTVFVTYDAVSDPSHKSAELKDITAVITNAGDFDKVCRPIGESSDILDESNELYQLREIFCNEIELDRVNVVVESFMNNLYMDYMPQKVQQNFIESNMTSLLGEYLSTSDYVTGISTNNVLNESNVMNFMSDYAINHSSPEYNTTSFMRNLTKQYLL